MKAEPTRALHPIVGLASDSLLMNEVYQLRKRAWHARGISINGLQDGTWNDSHDAHATHWLIRGSNQELVGAARLCQHLPSHDLPDGLIPPVDQHTQIAVISRLVVDPEHQRHGIARDLDLARIEHARLAGCGTVIVSILNGSPRLRALELLGFAPYYSTEHSAPSGLPSIVLQLRLTTHAMDAPS